MAVVVMDNVLKQGMRVPAMVKTIKYGDLEDALLSFGFQLSVTPEKFRLFRHPQSEAVVMLPAYRRDRAALQTHIVSVRGTLDGFGFLNRDEFDDVVRNHGRAAS
jgi:hypothetical protein